uniref:ATP synthase complex subunit 8 n=1 Tax=Metacrangonyx sp. 4 MDMBR-2012 TaxID=1200663 RepID=K7ZVX5_9CRUS|nr:ATP synthase F0 subunit 8 [Metacrangonyx sp. 4 MDMBR-2012]
MPQMAPSLWLIIYLVMNLMVILIMNNLFFFSEGKMTKSIAKGNKVVGLLWQ